MTGPPLFQADNTGKSLDHSNIFVTLRRLNLKSLFSMDIGFDAKGLTACKYPWDRVLEHLFLTGQAITGFFRIKAMKNCPLMVWRDQDIEGFDRHEQTSGLKKNCRRWHGSPPD